VIAGREAKPIATSSMRPILWPADTQLKVISICLRDLRLDRDLTQKQVGAAIGMSGQWVSAVENGYRTLAINVEHLLLLLKLYGVSLIEFTQMVDRSMRDFVRRDS